MYNITLNDFREVNYVTADFDYPQTLLFKGLYLFCIFYKQLTTTTCTYVDTIKVVNLGLDQCSDKSIQYDDTDHYLVVTEPS